MQRQVANGLFVSNSLLTGVLLVHVLLQIGEESFPVFHDIFLRVILLDEAKYFDQIDFLSAGRRLKKSGLHLEASPIKDIFLPKSWINY